MWTHAGENPYQYIHCDRALSFKNTLDQHMNTHIGEKYINATNVKMLCIEGLYVPAYDVSHQGKTKSRQSL